MKIVRFVTALLVGGLALTTLAQDTLTESFTASNGITVSFPEGYSASEQANGELVTMTSADETVTYLFLNGEVLEGAVGEDLPTDIAEAADQVQAALTAQGGDFSDTQQGEFDINEKAAIGRTYKESNGSTGAFILFILENDAPILMLVTSTDSSFEPDLPFLLEVAEGVSIAAPRVSNPPRMDGDLVVVDVADGQQLTFELPDGWALANLEMTPPGMALVGAAADTNGTTNAMIIDLTNNRDPLAFFNEQVASFAESAGHTDFSMEEHVVNATTTSGFPISFYESAEFVNDASDDTPSVVVALVQLEEGRYVFLEAQSVPKAELEDWAGEAADMANSLALRAAFSVVPADAVKIECSTASYDVVTDANPTAVVACPADCLNTSASIWGTEIYTDDSAVCFAAIHAGVIENATGGAFTVNRLPGQDAYTGSIANGVTTSEYGSWGGSFEVKVLGD